VVLDPNTFIDAVLDVLYRVPLSAAMKTSIKTQILLTGQVDDTYWTNAWLTYVGDPSNMAGYNVVYTRLQTFYKYLMNLAEYQLA
jgi:hypothetical protein